MRTITPCLWFDGNAEEAANFYTSLLPDSGIDAVHKAPRDGGSEVTWAMEGPSPLVTKVMDVVIGMDKMVSSDFEDGWRNLKEIAEKP
jgi:predicted 3-demethylubiquinone-9 3-methyltransferase (glyoxalase superfamily)